MRNQKPTVSEMDDYLNLGVHQINKFREEILEKIFIQENRFQQIKNLIIENNYSDRRILEIYNSWRIENTDNYFQKNIADYMISKGLFLQNLDSYGKAGEKILSQISEKVKTYTGLTDYNSIPIHNGDTVVNNKEWSGRVFKSDDGLWRVNYGYNKVLLLAREVTNWGQAVVTNKDVDVEDSKSIKAQNQSLLFSFKKNIARLFSSKRK